MIRDPSGSCPFDEKNYDKRVVLGQSVYGTDQKNYQS